MSPLLAHQHPEADHLIANEPVPISDGLCTQDAWPHTATTCQSASMLSILLHTAHIMNPGL